jgi:hypothetical protein
MSNPMKSTKPNMFCLVASFLTESPLLKLIAAKKWRGINSTWFLGDVTAADILPEHVSDDELNIDRIGMRFKECYSGCTILELTGWLGYVQKELFMSPDIELNVLEAHPMTDKKINQIIGQFLPLLLIDPLAVLKRNAPATLDEIQHALENVEVASLTIPNHGTWINKYFSEAEQEAWGDLLPLAEIEVNRATRPEQDEEKTASPFTGFRLVKVERAHVPPLLGENPVL